jgi:hypothetical protein
MLPPTGEAILSATKSSSSSLGNKPESETGREHNKTVSHSFFLENAEPYLIENMFSVQRRFPHQQTPDCQHPQST